MLLSAGLILRAIFDDSPLLISKNKFFVINSCFFERVSVRIIYDVK